MNDDELLSEIRKEAEEYILRKTGTDFMTGTKDEDHNAFNFILLRIAKIENRLEELDRK